MQKKRIAGVFLLVLLFLSCASSGDSAMSAGFKKFDSGIKVKDMKYSFPDGKKIFLYSARNNKEENMAIDALTKLFNQKGIPIVVDRGESLIYDEAGLVLKTSKKLMSVMTYVYLLRPGVKGNEDVIAIVYADSPQKVSEIVFDYIVNEL